MQTKTLIKRTLWSLIVVNGLFNPYSFFHYTQNYNDNTINTAISQDQSHTSGPTTTLNKISVWFHTNTVYADDNTKTKTDTDTELAWTLEAFLKVIYVLLWPLLWIAGIAMDNSLVYGEYFWLDNALFKFWSIMKNFANFALWFLFVRSIVSYVINPNEKKNPKDMITKLLVAGVWVQLSWFLIGALVDLSTVLTVGIWWLPLQLISNDSELAKKPVLWVKTSVKLNDKIWSDGNLVVLYTWPGSKYNQDAKYFLPCYIENQKVDFWPKWSQAFGITAEWSAAQSQTITGTNNVTRGMIVQDFCIVGNNIVNKNIYYSGSQQQDNSLAPQIWDTKMWNIFKDSQTQLRAGWACDSSNACQTMKTFAKSSEWYQWAFYSLYASLLGLSTIHIGVPKSTTSLVMETLIKTIVWLAYLIPLAILCIVLIMRVWYLWLIIAFSPFIILASVKDLGIKKIDGWFQLGDIKTKFNLTSVISLLLLPVIVTFTISLSIVFLSSLSEWLTKWWGAEALGIYSRVESTYKCYDIAITDICIDMPKQDIGSGIFDYFSWFIMNLFGVGLMWFAVMAALQSSEFTKWVAQSVQKLSENMLANAPIIPVAGGTSFKALQDLPGDLQRKLGEWQRNNQQVLTNIIEGKVSDMVGKDEKGNKEMEKLILDSSTSASTKLTNMAAFAESNAMSWTNLDFHNYDSSTKFANNLLEKWLKENLTDKNGKAIMTLPAFTSGKDLFHSPDGQQLLASLLDKQENKDTGSLRSLFSSKNDKAIDAEWAEIKSKIDALRATKKEAPSAVTVTFTDSITRKAKKVGIENNTLKIVDEWKELSTAGENDTLWIDPTSKQWKDKWDKVITVLNTLKKDDANKLDWVRDKLINKILETSDGKKYIIKLNWGKLELTPNP